MQRQRWSRPPARCWRFAAHHRWLGAVLAAGGAGGEMLPDLAEVRGYPLAPSFNAPAVINLACTVSQCCPRQPQGGVATSNLL